MVGETHGPRTVSPCISGQHSTLTHTHPLSFSRHATHKTQKYSTPQRETILFALRYSLFSFSFFTHHSPWLNQRTEDTVRTSLLIATVTVMKTHPIQHYHPTYPYQHHHHPRRHHQWQWLESVQSGIWLWLFYHQSPCQLFLSTQSSSFTGRFHINWHNFTIEFLHCEYFSLQPCDCFRALRTCPSRRHLAVSQVYQYRVFLLWLIFFILQILLLGLLVGSVVGRNCKIYPGVRHLSMQCQENFLRIWDSSIWF